MGILITAIAFLAALISWGVAFVAWRWRTVPGGRAFVGLLLSLGWWSFCYALEVALTSYAGVMLAAQMAYIGIVTVPVLWFVFALFHTGRIDTLQKEQWTAFFIIPAITLGLVLTNASHGLIWSHVTLQETTPQVLEVLSYGAGFFIHTAYSYLLIVGGSLVLLHFSLRHRSLYRNQALLLILTALLPLVGNLAYLLGWLPIPALDPTALLFAVSSWLMAWGIYRYRLLDIVPVARRTLVDSMTDAMVAIDLQQRIVDLNPAAENLVGMPAANLLGHRISEVLPEHEALIAQFRGVPDAHAELSLNLTGTPGYYDMRISPLYNQRGQLAGLLLVLRDITERKQLESRLEAQMRRFEQLLAVARATTEQPTLEATLKNTLDIAVALTSAERGSIFLMDTGGKVTHSILARGHLPAVAARELVGQVMTAGLSGWILQNQAVALIDNAANDPRWLTLSEQPYAVGSVLGVPIEQGEQVIGVLVLQHPAQGHFSSHDADVMTAAVQQMALAIRNAHIYEEQRRMADQQVTLYEVLRALQTIHKPKQMLRTAVNVIARLTAWPLVALIEAGDDPQSMALEAVAGPLTANFTVKCPIFIAALRHVCESKRAYYIDGVHRRLQQEGLGSLLFLPIAHTHPAQWILCVGNESLDAFDSDARVLAESLVEVIQLAIRNAHLYASLQTELTERERAEEQLRVSLRKTDALYQISRALIATREMAEVLHAATEGAVQAINADCVTLIRLDLATEQILDFVESGPGAHRVVHVSWDELMAGLSGWVVRHVTPAISPQDASDLRESEAVRRRREETEVGAIIVVPLHYMGRIYGTMTALNQPGQPDFTPGDMDLLAALAAQVAVAIHNITLFDKVVEQQNRLQALVQSTRDGVVLIGDGLRVLVINQPALTLLQLPGDPASWTDAPLQDALRLLRPRAPRVVRVFLEETRRVRNGDSRPGQGEYQIGNRHLQWLNLPVVSHDASLGRLLILHDVTEARMLEEMHADLTHTMVHDLRNPLTGINGALMLLNKSAAELSLAQRDLLDIAHHSTQKMLNLVNAILDISRLESGRMPIHPTAFAPATLVDEVVSLQRPLVEQRHIHLINTVTADAPLVYADASLIMRVLQNLVGNAIKFTPSGGTVRVAVDLDARAADKLRFSVSDTGAGIPLELRDRLFGKFVTGNAVGRGSGLGLAFCKMVLEAHAERIWVDSEPGAGATFIFTLPLAPRAEA